MIYAYYILYIILWSCLFMQLNLLALVCVRILSAVYKHNIILINLCFVSFYFISTICICIYSVSEIDSNHAQLFNKVLG